AVAYDRYRSSVDPKPGQLLLDQLLERRHERYLQGPTWLQLGARPAAGFRLSPRRPAPTLGGPHQRSRLRTMEYPVTDGSEEMEGETCLTTLQRRAHSSSRTCTRYVCRPIPGCRPTAAGSPSRSRPSIATKTRIRRPSGASTTA